MKFVYREHVKWLLQTVTKGQFYTLFNVKVKSNNVWRQLKNGFISHLFYD